MTGWQLFEAAKECFDHKQFDKASDLCLNFVSSLDHQLSASNYRVIDKINTYAAYYDWANHLFLTCFYEDAVDYYKILFKSHPFPEVKERLEISKARRLKPKSFNDKYGYANKQGEMVIAPKWDLAEEFCEGLGYVTINGLSGLIDRDGNEVIPPRFEHVLCGEYTQTLYPVQLNGKWGFVSPPDKQIIPCIYDYASTFEEGMAIVKKNGKYGLINQNEDVVIPITYDEILFPSEGLISVQKNGKYGVINQENKLVVDFVYDSIFRFHEGYAIVGNEWKYGFIDISGDLVIDLTYDYANSFSNGIAHVLVKDNFYYINKNNKIIYSSKKLNINKIIYENTSCQSRANQKQ